MFHEHLQADIIRENWSSAILEWEGKLDSNMRTNTFYYRIANPKLSKKTSKSASQPAPPKVNSCAHFISTKETKLKRAAF